MKHSAFTIYIFLLLFVFSCSNSKEVSEIHSLKKNVLVDISVYNRNYDFEVIQYEIQIDSNIILRDSTATHFFKSITLPRGNHFLFARDLKYDISSLIKFHISDSAHNVGVKIFNEYVPPYQEHLEFLADERIRHKQLDTINNKDARKDYIKSLWNRDDKKHHRQVARSLRMEYYENLKMHAHASQ